MSKTVNGVRIRAKPFIETVRVRKTGNQSIPASTFTVVTFNLEDFDTASMHDNVTNNSRLVAPVTGKYLLSSTLHYDTDANGTRYVAYSINGGALLTLQNVIPMTSFPTFVNGSTVISLNATDFVEISAFQSTVGALNVLSGGHTFASLTFIAI